MLVLLSGYAGAGKSTAAKALVRNRKFKRFSFGDPLKKMLMSIGIPKANLYGTEEEKNAPLDIIGGKTARYAMQTLGTEWGRDMIHPNLWASLLYQDVHHHLSTGGNAVIDDVRFPSELSTMLWFQDSLVLRINGEACDKTPRHKSELVMEQYAPLMFQLNNDRTRQFTKNVLSFVDQQMELKLARSKNRRALLNALSLVDKPQPVKEGQGYLTQPKQTFVKKPDVLDRILQERINSVRLFLDRD